MTFPLDAEPFLPHRPPMRLIDQIVSYDGQQGSGLAFLSSESPWVIDHEGRIDRVVMVELVAQCFAALQGYDNSLKGGGAQKGFLVGVSQAEYFADARAGHNTIINVRNDEAFEDFRFATGEVWQNEVLLARITLKIWLSSEDKIRDNTSL